MPQDETVPMLGGLQAPPQLSPSLSKGELLGVAWGPLWQQVMPNLHLDPAS